MTPATTRTPRAQPSQVHAGVVNVEPPVRSQPLILVSADPDATKTAVPKPAGPAKPEASILAAARPVAKLARPAPSRVFKVPLDIRAFIESDEDEVRMYVLAYRLGSATTLPGQTA